MRLPPGFRFQEGVDGLLIGLSIVFLVKLKMVVSRFIDWRLLPAWTWKPIKDLEFAVGDMARATAQGVGHFVQFGGAGRGTASSSSSAILSADAIAQTIMGAGKVVGVPLLLTGSLSGNVFEQVFIIVGFWIAALFPLYNWVLRPAYFRLQRLHFA